MMSLHTPDKFLKTYACSSCQREFRAASGVPIAQGSSKEGFRIADTTEARLLDEGKCPACGAEVKITHFQYLVDFTTNA